MRNEQAGSQAAARSQHPRNAAESSGESWRLPVHNMQVDGCPGTHARTDAGGQHHYDENRDKDAEQCPCLASFFSGFCSWSYVYLEPIAAWNSEEREHRDRRE